MRDELKDRLEGYAQSLDSLCHANEEQVRASVVLPLSAKAMRDARRRIVELEDRARVLDQKLGMAVAGLQPFAAIELPPETWELEDGHVAPTAIRLGDVRRAREIHDLMFVRIDHGEQSKAG